jgi:hypothetical protein
MKFINICFIFITNKVTRISILTFHFFNESRKDREMNDMSVKNKPLKAWFTKLLENMLSISVAVFDVILVGRVIKGKNELEYIISRNSFVNWWLL